ncbi:heme-binding-like protein At3g10130, chloroplastic isoform X1 [Ananas comosus]|uniref:Heme-binding-like protein At3g10130, chloroplastic isoform X1 n=1 Tax=Ananas comosus TaxID=4615 RepID=A0A6P5GRA8_ANACO|nr:heme-binding-like protein At3g10130, chloroplastic isoform X1 [Ananas comosus]
MIRSFFSRYIDCPVLGDLVAETAKYAFPRRYEARNLEEALMSVPDLETVKYRVIKRTDYYEIREVEPYFIAETTMPGQAGFDFNGASQSFNVLAAYLFGKNTASEQMEMTTPVYTRKVQPSGEKMDMTTPVITKRSPEQDKWQMSFVMPSKYGSNLPVPKDSSVSIKEVPGKIVAVTAFSGFVTDEDVKRREAKLRNALHSDGQFRVKEDASVEVAQFNPPFTLPFTRRNEIALEVERKAE